MDAGKENIFKERRKQRASSVRIVFVDSDRFNVVDEEGNLKYVGCLDPCDCTCPSFINGNTEQYIRSHPAFFKCKHIYQAEQIRNQDKPKQKINPIG